MRCRIPLRARSGRSIVCVKKNRNAETMLFIVHRHAGIALLYLPEPAHVIRRGSIR